jgi:hypothetical protein
MRTVRNIAFTLGAAGALALGSAALAQDSPKPEAKSEASQEHRGEHGMNRMREMRGGCHGESHGAAREEHDHS